MLIDSGVIVLNKPTGMSSNLALQIAKRAVQPKKMGHLGTLDPLGSGVLLLTVNNATKMFDEYLKKDKTYFTIFKFGMQTTTLDSEGEINAQNECDITLNQVQEVAKKFVGEFDQMPPDFSAKKINGKKAYELARKGEKVELKTKHITIFETKVIEKIEKNTFSFSITCSSGTYIRSICRDIAKELSTFGTMVAIVRTRCGDYNISQSCTLEQLKEGKYNLL